MSYGQGVLEKSRAVGPRQKSQLFLAKQPKRVMRHNYHLNMGITADSLTREGVTLQTRLLFAN